MFFSSTIRNSLSVLYFLDYSEHVWVPSVQVIKFFIIQAWLDIVMVTMCPFIINKEIEVKYVNTHE